MSSRNLLALYIVLIMLPLTLTAYRFVANVTFDYNEINDEIALNQLRNDLLFIYDLDYSYGELRFLYKDRNCSLKMINNKLILTPGTQIYLYDVDNLYFDVINDCVYVNYERENKEYKRVLCYAKGLYIDDFSSCDDDDDNSDSGQE